MRTQQGKRDPTFLVALVIGIVIGGPAGVLLASIVAGIGFTIGGFIGGVIWIRMRERSRTRGRIQATISDQQRELGESELLHCCTLLLRMNHDARLCRLPMSIVVPLETLIDLLRELLLRIAAQENRARGPCFTAVHETIDDQLFELIDPLTKMTGGVSDADAERTIAALTSIERHVANLSHHLDGAHAARARVHAEVTALRHGGG